MRRKTEREAELPVVMERSEETGVVSLQIENSDDGRGGVEPSRRGFQCRAVHGLESPQCRQGQAHKERSSQPNRLVAFDASRPWITDQIKTGNYYRGAGVNDSSVS